MAGKIEKYKKLILVGIVFIALSVVFRDSENSLGVVFLGVGGLFLIAGVSNKWRGENSD